MPCVLWDSTSIKHAFAAEQCAVRGQFGYSRPRFSIAGYGIMVPMSSTVKNVVWAIVWFVLGHLSCAVVHHFHHQLHGRWSHDHRQG